jgi:hypothetical protein
MLARYRVLESALTANSNNVVAAQANGPAAHRAETPTRAERRGAKRPWVGKAGKSGTATKVAEVSPARLSVARATANGADNDWREF